MVQNNSVHISKLNNKNICENTNDLSNKFHCFATTADILRPKKKQKRDHLSTITLGWIDTRKSLNKKKTKSRKRIRILFDSGCEATLVNGKFLTHLKKRK